MAGLEDKLSGILSDPEAVMKLKSLGSALGLDTGNTPPKSMPFINQSDDMTSTLMRLAPLLADMSKDDEVSCLLNALRPFLSEPRRERLEQAGKMLKVMKLLPLLRGWGIG
ncbi:MAG: hypothetical protein IJF52_05915 [Clostridia bacterium]|nr:hypothetical protein [Clostridia bacterium]